MIGAKFINQDGIIQIDENFSTLRVIESGEIASNTSVNFTRQAGSLYVRPQNSAHKVYMNSSRTRILCSNGGTIMYVVLHNASSFSGGGQFGLKIIRSDLSALSFSDQMQFPRIRYDGAVSGLTTSGFGLNMPAPYPGCLSYVSIFSLGLDTWQIGSSLITYRNVALKFSPDNTVISVSYIETQISSSVGETTWGSYNSFRVDLPNRIQIIEV